MYTDLGYILYVCSFFPLRYFWWWCFLCKMWKQLMYCTFSSYCLPLTSMYMCMYIHIITAVLVMYSHVYTCITAVLVLNTCCNLLARSHALNYSMIFGPTCIYVQVKLVRKSIVQRHKYAPHMGVVCSQLSWQPGPQTKRPSVPVAGVL